MRELRLDNLISLELLQKVQDNFSAAVGVAMVIVDKAGVPVTRPSGFSAFCQAARASGVRRDQCFRCDDEGARRALATGEPSIYRCHCGLVDFAAPIIVRGQYLGGIIAGQVWVSDDDEDATRLEYISPPDGSWRQDPHLCALREEIETISFQKLRSASYTLFHMASYLVEEGYSNAVNQELHAKNMRLLEESKKRVELEKSLREAELQALSYQVNPHFIFNVMNTIGRLARKEQAPQTETVLYEFADMLRYVLKKSHSQIVPFGHELKHVRNFINIQKVRMGDRLSVDIDIPERYEEVLCPFMVLHPIVENSINYAIEPRDEDGHISIRALDDGKDLIIEVSDNGEGFAPGVAEKSLAGVANHHGRPSIGLHNIDSRMRYYFGPDYKIHIENKRIPEEGAFVQMRIPLQFDPCYV